MSVPRDEDLSDIRVSDTTSRAFQEREDEVAAREDISMTSGHSSIVSGQRWNNRWPHFSSPLPSSMRSLHKEISKKRGSRLKPSRSAGLACLERCGPLVV